MLMKPPARLRPVVFYFVRIALAAALLAGSISLAVAEQVVYEHYYYGSDTDNVDGTTWKAQTFVPATTHPVRIIRLKLQKQGNPPGNMTVSLKATNAGGAPAGSALASASIACSSFTTLNLWYDFDLGADYTLSAGTTYAFVLSVPSGDASNVIWNCIVSSPKHNYPAGQMWASYSSGSSWSALPAWDTVFKIVGPGTNTATPNSNPKITGYLHELNVRADPTILDRIDFAKLDYVFYVGLRATGDTDPTLTSGFPLPDVVAHIDQCVTKGHAAGARVMLSFCCGDNSTYLHSIVASDPLRAQLVTNLTDFVTAHNLDGVDIDWESGESQAEMDTLINALAPAMHGIGKLVSFAGSCYGEDCTLSAFSNVDFVNVMTYDMAHNAYRPIHALYEDATAVISMWADDGYDRSKLYMGIPFYGRDLSHFYDYKTIVDNLNPSSDQDYATVSTLGGTAVDGGLVWWNGIDLAKRKADWAVDNGIAGLMVYELAEDELQDPRSLLKAVYDEKVSRAAYDVPHLSVAKSTSTASARPGEVVTYTITYRNSGTGDITNLQISDVVPFNAYISEAAVGGSADSVEYYVGGSWTSTYSTAATKIRWHDAVVAGGGGDNTVSYRVKIR